MIRGPGRGRVSLIVLREAHWRAASAMMSSSVSSTSLATPFSPGVEYSSIMAVGLMVAVYLVSGYAAPNPLGGLAILILESLATLSITMFGSTLMSTLANGVMTFMLYGVAFVVGWVEKLGMLFEHKRIGLKAQHDVLSQLDTVYPHNGVFGK